MALTDNLVSYWKLDESSGNAADSHGSNTLTNQGTLTYAAAKINNGGVFDDGKYLDIADASQSGLDLSTALSFSLWYKPAVQDEQQNPLIVKMADNNESYAFTYFISGTPNLRLVVDKTGNGTTQESLSVNQTLTNDTFYHLVVTWLGSSKVATFYVNGSSIGTSTGTTVDTLFNGNASFELGRNQRAPLLSAEGIIDEVGVWSREITSAEVTELYNGGAGLAYPFTGGGGTIMANNHFLLMGV